MQIIADIGKNFIDKDWNFSAMSVPYYAERAVKLIKEAKLAGATVAKFQTHVFDDEQDYRDKSRYDWIKFNESITPVTFWKELRRTCDYEGIEFMTTPMSKLAAQKVNHLVDRWKVSSADITNFDLLNYLKETKKPIILSTGMSTEEQITEAVRFLGDQIELINYCVSIYPCPIYKINLARLFELMALYNLPVGLSDHSLSIEVPVMALKMGAIAIEKHFTLDRNLPGPDHKVSLVPEEFKKMVDLCNLAEKEGESFEEEKLYWKKFRINN